MFQDILMSRGDLKIEIDSSAHLCYCIIQIRILISPTQRR